MEIVKRVSRMRELGRDLRERGDSIALVPTMGALHDGHLSLLRRGREMADRVVLSLFVNPTQFGPDEDLDRYPRDEHRDTDLAKREGVDYVFMPEAREMYPDGFRTYVSVTELEDKLCGESRPGHFRGVCTVVAKLLHIVQPQFAVFGEKDAQQLLIIERMVRDLDLPVEVVAAPTVRDDDGLALSSRNRYLDGAERRAAAVLSRGLGAVGEQFVVGVRQAAELKATLDSTLAAEPLAEVEYASLVDRRTLLPVTVVDRPTLCALAVRIGATRLIDNLTLRPEGD